MSNQYDANVAAMYDRSFTEIPLRRYVELPSAFGAVGDVTGLSILDLACGTGYYAKEFRRRGAARVLGVDLAEEMIRAARAQEAREPLGIEYTVGDAAALGRVGEFDIVTGIHLLHYAGSYPQLSGMCRSIGENLKPGGRFIGYQLNPDVSPAPHYYDRYCYNVRIAEHAADGQPFHFSVTVGDITSPEMTAFYWSRRSLESALAAAALTDLHWIVPAPSPEGIQRHRADFWTGLVEKPFELIVTCRKN